MDALLYNVQWSGWTVWADEEKAVVTEVLHDLQSEGQGLPATERLLNQLLRFFTGSFKEPVEGWENTKVEFNRVSSEKPGFAESVILYFSFVHHLNIWLIFSRWCV